MCSSISNFLLSFQKYSTGDKKSKEKSSEKDKIPGRFLYFAGKRRRRSKGVSFLYLVGVKSHSAISKEK